MKPVITTPYEYAREKENVDKNILWQDDNASQHRLGYCESQHKRRTMEDALTYAVLDNQGDVQKLSPQQIGERLWTTLKIIDDECPDNKQGSTVSTTVYDGRDHLITATLGDAVSFIAAYDTRGTLLGVHRLNSVTHKPGDETEKNRINQLGGNVLDWGGVPRVCGLALSRAIGDKDAAPYVSADAKIDTLSLSDLAQSYGMPKDGLLYKVITTCDGFTDGAEEQSQAGHEAFLKESLSQTALGDNEATIAEKLVQCAKTKSQDNITVAVLSLSTSNTPMMLGVFDGHGGQDIAAHVANTITEKLSQQLSLAEVDYQKQPFSVHNNQKLYDADHKKDERLISALKKLIDITHQYKNNLSQNNKQQHDVIDELLRSLKYPSHSPEKRINNFYETLDKKSAGKTNLEVLLENKDVPTKRFIAGIAAIALTLVTGILPGLLVIGAVYALTNKSPKDWFKSHAVLFAEKVNAIKPQSDAPPPSPKR